MALSEYKKRVFEFLDAPWQEDSEIQLISLFSEYREDMRVNTDSSIRNYLKSMIEANNLFGNQMLSDGFTINLSELTS